MPLVYLFPHDRPSQGRETRPREDRPEGCLSGSASVPHYAPHSHAEGYRFSDSGEDYLVGALARINLNRDLLHPRTRDDTANYLSAFPTNNVHHNNLAQSIEILHCVDDAIDLLRTIQVVDEGGVVEDYDVIVPTAQNQINIENDLKDYFTENLDKDGATLRAGAEGIIRAYDPCMSCATNFLKMDLIRG